MVCEAIPHEEEATPHEELVKTADIASRRVRVTAFNPCCSVFALAILLAIYSPPVLSAPRISGNSENLVVDTQNSSLDDVLSALRRDFNFHFRSSVNLEKPIGGLYRGTLQQVVTHILEGYSFTMKFGAEGIELTVLAAPSTYPPESGSQLHDPYSFLRRDR
jgi:hypothetical protein